METEIAHQVFGHRDTKFDFDDFHTFISLFNLCAAQKMKRMTFDKLFEMFSRKFKFHFRISRVPSGQFNPKYHVNIFEEGKWITLNHKYYFLERNTVKYYGLREKLIENPVENYFIRGENFDTRWNHLCNKCNF